MKSFYYYLLITTYFNIISSFLYQPPGVATRSKQHQFLQYVTPLPLLSTPIDTTTAYKSLTIPYPKAKTIFKTKIESDRFKNEIEDGVVRTKVEKQHEKKLSDILPLVTFDCHDRSEGYYADVTFKCEVFHYCGKPNGKRFTFFCPSGSRFNQIHMICDYEMFQACDKSHEFFHLNDKIYPKDNTTYRPVTVTRRPVTTTQRQIAVTKPKSLESKPEVRRPARSRQAQRRWAVARTPYVMRYPVPERMARGELSSSRVLFNRPMMTKTDSRLRKIVLPVPVSVRRDVPRIPVLRSHFAPGRSLEYFPSAREFRRRPLPPPETVYDSDEPPLHMERKSVGESNRRNGQSPRKDKWDELDKMAERWKLGGKRAQNTKPEVESDESESESSEEEVTTIVNRIYNTKRPKTTTQKSTSPLPVPEITKTTSPNRKIKNPHPVRFINRKKPKTTTSTTPSTSSTTITTSTTTTRPKSKPKNRFSKVQRSRLKTSTFPPFTSATTKPSTNPNLIPTPTVETWTKPIETPVAAAIVDVSDSGGNEKSYV